MSFSANRKQNSLSATVQADGREPLTLSEAKRKLMDLVASRDHSEKELRTKLAQRCDDEVLEQTLEWAKGKNWLVSPENLKVQIAEKWARKGKGIRQMNEKLVSLGLEPIHSDHETEYTKAQKLALQKWSSADFIDLSNAEATKLKMKVMRYLATRGYESDVIRAILKNEFNQTLNLEEIYED